MMKQRTSSRPKRTTLAIAGAGALVATLGLGGVAHATGTDNADTHPATQGIVWLDDLLHPIDIADVLEDSGSVTSEVGPGDGDYGISACTGDTQMSSVVGDNANLFFGVFSGQADRGGKQYTISQHVADQATIAQARKLESTLIADVAACENEPAGHWRYGQARQFNSHVGTVTWLVTIEGDGTRVGGVMVARSGRHLSVAEITGAGTPKQIKGLAGDTLARVR